MSMESGLVNSNKKAAIETLESQPNILVQYFSTRMIRVKCPNHYPHELIMHMEGGGHPN